jgi:hypothetical protein
MSLKEISDLVSLVPKEELDDFISTLLNTDMAISFQPEFKKWRKLPLDSKPIHQSIVDRKKYEECLAGAKADCWEASMLLFLRLENIGVIRMRGKRVTERQYGGFHYWVENKDLVYEEHGGVRQIYKKETFYTKSHNITDAEPATIGDLFFEDEFIGRSKEIKTTIRRLRDKDKSFNLQRLNIVMTLIEKNKDAVNILDK